MLRAVGLMSGTSLDGIDVACLETDGEAVKVRPDWAKVPFLSVPYDEAFRDRLRPFLGQRAYDPALERELTLRHAQAVQDFLARNDLTAADVDLVGFHGQTTFHDPANRVTVQMGDGPLLAKELGIDVVWDFRSADVAAGGQGAPFASLYHKALAAEVIAAHGAVAVLNLGGVGNVTYLSEEHTLAFDTGPASALLDDWVSQTLGLPFDAGGAIAASGTVDQGVVDRCLAHGYFAEVPPKSLDRDDFKAAHWAHLGPADGAATLSAFTVQSVLAALKHLPSKPRRWFVTGGGRHNSHFMAELNRLLAVPVESVDVLDWNGDAIEAEAFAFLAVRSVKGLPLSVPTTTGVPNPMTGGKRAVAP